MQVTYDDKSNALPTSNPRRIFHDTDANELKNAINRNDHARGDWAGTTTLPSAGGTFTGGAPALGNRWRLTNQLAIGGNVYPAKTIIEAAVDNPGQTIANWIFYAVQL